MSDKFFGEVEATEPVVDNEVLAEVESVENEEVVESEAVNEVVPEVSNEVQFNATDYALGLCRSGSGFKVVKIPFNRDTLSTGRAEVLQDELMDRGHAEEAFKINVVREGIFGGS